MSVSTTINTDGTMTTTTTDRVTSSDIQLPGVSVQRGMGSVTVASPEFVEDSDLVTVDGVQITAGMAKEMGLLDRVFGTDKPKAESRTKAPAEVETKAQRQETGHEGFDGTSAEISDRVEAGDLTPEEAIDYTTSVATIAQSGLTITEVVDTIDGLRDGSVDPSEVDTERLHVATAVEEQVADAATRSAMQELGQEGFAKLSEMASASPMIDRAIRQYAAMRAIGRTSDSWTDILRGAEEELAGLA